MSDDEEWGNQGQGSDDPPRLQIEQTAKDPDIKRYRPLLLVGESSTGGGDGTIEDRAGQEAAARFGKAVTVRAKVAGWSVPGGGGPWRPNMTVRVDAPQALTEGLTLIVGAVEFTVSATGAPVTTLSLARPEAYLQAKKEKAKSAKKKGGGGGGGGDDSGWGET